jgi:itaconate CoA-transferase
LLVDADVFIQNLAPGATARLGLGADVLRARYPQLVVCDLSGYGASGPYVDKKAYDLLVQCEAALLSVTGTPEAPAKAGISVADIAGGMYAFSSVLMALFHRERAGVGTAIEVSLFDALVEWMGHPLYFAMYSGEPPARTGSAHATVFPYGSFTAGDGVPVYFGIQNEREWRRFCDLVLHRPEVAADERFVANGLRSDNRIALTEVIEAAFSAMTAEEVVGLLDVAEIAHAGQNDVAGLLAHPQLAERDRWRTVDSPGGSIAALRPPAIMHGLGERFDPIPVVGAHTDAILDELGFDADAIDALRRAGAI